jgi:hypothetical protein
MENEYACQPTQRGRLVGIRLAPSLWGVGFKGSKTNFLIWQIVKLLSQLKLNSITSCDCLEFPLFVTAVRTRADLTTPMGPPITARNEPSYATVSMKCIHMRQDLSRLVRRLMRKLKLLLLSCDN